MAIVSADPDELEDFLHRLRHNTEQLEESILALRAALDATASWQDSRKEEFEDALESMAQGVLLYVHQSRDEMEPWLLDKIAHLRDYGG